MDDGSKLKFVDNADGTYDLVTDCVERGSGSPIPNSRFGRIRFSKGLGEWAFYADRDCGVEANYLMQIVEFLDAKNALHDKNKSNGVDAS